MLKTILGGCFLAGWMFGTFIALWTRFVLMGL